jgi:hypothetical protein
MAGEGSTIEPRVNRSSQFRARAGGFAHRPISLTSGAPDACRIFGRSLAQRNCVLIPAHPSPCTQASPLRALTTIFDRVLSSDVPIRGRKGDDRAQMAAAPFEHLKACVAPRLSAVQGAATPSSFTTWGNDFQPLGDNYSDHLIKHPPTAHHG